MKFTKTALLILGTLLVVALLAEFAMAAKRPELQGRYNKPARIDEVVCNVGTVENRITNSTVEKFTGDNDYCILMGDDSGELASMTWKTPAVYSGNRYLYFGSLRVAYNGRLIGFTSDTSDSVTVKTSADDPDDTTRVSDFDTYFSITDQSNMVPDDYEQPGMMIKARTYAWSESYRDDFIIYDFWFLNIGEADIDSVWVGLHEDCDVSAAEGGSGAAGFWRDDKVGYYRDDINKEYISYMFDTDNSVVQGDDTGGNKVPKESEGYIGSRLLYCPPVMGADSSEHTRQSGHGWWDWNSDPDLTTDWYNVITDGVWLEPPPSPHDYRFLQKLGPFSIPQGDSIRVVFAFGIGKGLEGLRTNLNWAALLFESGWQGPSAPPSPSAEVDAGDREVTLTWSNSPASTVDPLSGQMDFEGYRVYKSLDQQQWNLLADFDVIDSVGLNTGIDTTYTDYDVLNGVVYYYAITSYDKGDPVEGIESLESGKTPVYEVQPGLYSETPSGEIHVVPNPFIPYNYLKDQWYFETTSESASEERIQFVNLPGACTIRIYSLTGDLVDTIEQPDPDVKVADWDLINKNDQKIVAGIYLFHVEPTDGGDATIGKFVVIR